MGNATGYNLKNFYNGIMKSQNPLYAYQFLAEFVGLDDSWGISDSTDAAHNITYYIQSATLPGIDMATGNATYLGKKFILPGPAKYAHTWTANILLEQSLTPYEGFRKWQEEISSFRMDGGGNKSIPNVQLRLSVLDSSGLSKVQAIVLEGVWVKSVGQIQMQYADGGGKPINSFAVEFRFQYNFMDDTSNFDSSTDPLKA